MRFLFVTLALLAQGAPSGLRGLEPSSSEGIIEEQSEIKPEDKLAYYESRAKDSFREFKGKVDSYVENLNENETISSIGNNMRGFYHWALNRDKWESVAIFVALALIVYTVAAILYAA